MIRRVFALLGCGAALVTFASCGTFETGTAATVNGSDIPTDRLERAGAQLSAVEGLREEFVDQFGGASASLQRNLLGLLIDNEVAGRLLADRGRPVTQDDLETAAQTLRDQGNTDLLDAGADVANAIAMNAAISTALGDLDVPSDDEIASLYATLPAQLGVVCANQVVVGTRQAADDAASRLAAGEPAEQVATAVGSTAPSVDLIGAAGAPCPDLSDLSTSLPPAIYHELLRAKPGVPLGPYATTDGDGSSIWVVVQVQHLDDAADDLATALSANPGSLAYLGASATADVWVASKFGTWDPATRTVVALTAAAG